MWKPPFQNTSQRRRSSTGTGKGSGSSSDQSSSPKSPTSRRGPLNIGNFKNRVLTPHRHLPIITVDLPEDEEKLSHLESLFGITGTLEKEVSRIAQGTMNGDEKLLRVDLKMRASRNNIAGRLPTVLLEVNKWTPGSPEKWQIVVERVKKHVDRRLLLASRTEGSTQIAVEMVSSVLLKTKYLSPLEMDDDYPRIEKEWPIIREKIFEIGQSHPATKGNIAAISIFRLGFEQDEKKNPKTIYVSVSYESPEKDWPDIVDAMQRYLDDLDLKLQVHLEHNEIELNQAFTLLPPDPTPERIAGRENTGSFDYRKTYSTKVGPGADISAAKYVPRRDDNQEVNPVVGTFGCWLNIKKKKGETITVGLTNYHVIRSAIDGFCINSEDGYDDGGESTSKLKIKAPRLNSRLRQTDREGYTPNSMIKDELVEHPARANHNYAIQELTETKESALQHPENAGLASEAEGALEAKISFFDTKRHILGKVYRGSGFLKRTDTGGRLDYALILPEHTSQRVGTNSVDVLQFKEKYREDLCPGQEGLSPLEQGGVITLSGPTSSTSLKNTTVDDHVRLYKVGARTKCTIGEFSRLKSMVRIKEEIYMYSGGENEEEQYSTEFVVIGVGRRPGSKRLLFADKGDSGAVVWDGQGRVLGLLFRGHVPQQADADYTFVMPIEDVLDDIKRESTFQDVRLRT